MQDHFIVIRFDQDGGNAASDLKGALQRIVPHMVDNVSITWHHHRDNAGLVWKCGYFPAEPSEPSEPFCKVHNDRCNP